MNKLDEIEALMSERGGIYDLDPADVKLLIRAVRELEALVHPPLGVWGQSVRVQLPGR